MNSKNTGFNIRHDPPARGYLVRGSLKETPIFYEMHGSDSKEDEPTVPKKRDDEDE